MTKIKLLILASIAVAAISACGGGGSGGSNSGPPPPPIVTKTFSVTLTAVAVDRSADQLSLDVTGLPAEGATVSVTE